MLLLFNNVTEGAKGFALANCSLSILLEHCFVQLEPVLDPLEVFVLLSRAVLIYVVQFDLPIVLGIKVMFVSVALVDIYTLALPLSHPVWIINLFAH